MQSGTSVLIASQLGHLQPARLSWLPGQLRFSPGVFMASLSLHCSPFLAVQAETPVLIASWLRHRQSARLSWLAGRWRISLAGFALPSFQHPRPHSFFVGPSRHRVGDFLSPWCRWIFRCLTASAMLIPLFISAGFAVPHFIRCRVLVSHAGGHCGLTHHSTGPARKAAQAG